VTALPPITTLPRSTSSPLATAFAWCGDGRTRRLVWDLDEASPTLVHHGAGVAALAGAVGTRLRFGRSRLATLSRAALLHDVGKRFVPRALLEKPQGLAAHERRVVEMHATVGSMLLLQEGLLAEAAIVRHHHERWDGSGYPDGLAGTAIPLGARIVAVCDAYRAMTEDRPYRPALSDSEARLELQNAADAQFDSECVAALLRALDRRDSAATVVALRPPSAGVTVAERSASSRQRPRL
jgi:HD-GYP domain-containing protein (c-di-GMP phosphodiesterase class II)